MKKCDHRTLNIKNLGDGSTRIEFRMRVERYRMDTDKNWCSKNSGDKNLKQLNQ